MPVTGIDWTAVLLNQYYIGTALDDSLTGSIGNDTLIGGEGADTILGGDGHDDLRGFGGADVIFGGIGRDLINGGEGDDTLDGGDDNDTLSGASGHDLIYGGNGHDLIKAGSDNDTLWGGSGNDDLRGQSGDDFLYGESGHDKLRGDWGNDWLDGGTGRDQLSGGDGNDTLVGGNNEDRVYGDAGDDLIVDGAGYDIMEGGAGNDTIETFSRFEGDYISGGEGFDTVVLSGTRESYTVQYATGTRAVLVDADGGTITVDDVEEFVFSDVTLRLDQYGGLPGINLTLSQPTIYVVESTNGTTVQHNSFDMRVYTYVETEYSLLTTADNLQARFYLSSTAGMEGLIDIQDDDVGFNLSIATQGSAGVWFDTSGLEPGTYYYAVEVDPDNVVFEVSEQDNFSGWVEVVIEDGRVFGTEFADVLTDSSLTEDFYGLGGNDTITAGTYDDVFGGEGDDLLTGGGYVWGDAGNDTISGNVLDEAHGGDGNDVIDFSEVYTATAYGGAGDDTIYGSNWSGHGTVAYATLNGGDGNDVIYGGTVRGTLNGGDGNDVIYGGAAGETIVLGNGDDLFVCDPAHTSAAAGRDTFVFLDTADAGNDTLSGYDALPDAEYAFEEVLYFYVAPEDVGTYEAQMYAFFNATIQGREFAGQSVFSLTDEGLLISMFNGGTVLIEGQFDDPADIFILGDCIVWDGAEPDIF